MGKIIGAYQNLQAAQEAMSRLVESMGDAVSLSIIGPDRSDIAAKSSLNKTWAWGIALGAMVGFLLPGGGHALLAGHLARAIAIHALGVTAKGALAGAATVGTIHFARRGLVDRSLGAAETVGQGQYALALDGDWVTMQRARVALGDDQQPATDPHVFEMTRRYGYEHQSFLSLYGGMETWALRHPEAVVVYRRVGHVAVVAAAPLTARENLAEVTRRFLAFCEARKMDCLMLPIGTEFAEIARACGMGLLHVGESGYFRLPEWRPAGDRAKKVRAGVNQASKAGVRIESYDPFGQQVGRQAPQTRAEIEELCQAWVNTREVDALGWLLELNPFHLCEHKRYFLARNANDKLEGMLVCSPIYAQNGWYLEDLIRRPGAERGVSELLTVEALKRLAAEGATLATLGTSPLAGVDSRSQFKLTSSLLKLIYEHFDAFYHFKALHRFKAKFAPTFVDQEYIAVYPPRIRPRMAFAVIGALDPAGLSGLMASKLRRLWRKKKKVSESAPAGN